MKPLDLLLYLFGNRNSIERIAASRLAWLIGAILVLSAGIARNYDHLDLLREPEWFIGPFVASLVSAIFIYLWLCGPLIPIKKSGFWKQFLIFLTLVWLTAPCAWLYGIPVESFTDIITATKWNIAFLAVVSIWRVAIIVRAISVLTDNRWFRVLPLILAPASIEMFIGSNYKAISLIGIMGGVRLPPHTQLLYDATRFTQVVSFYVFIAALIACFILRGKTVQPLTRTVLPTQRPVFVVAAISLLAWAAFSFPAQPKLRNLHELRTLVRKEDPVPAVVFASSRTRNDFPANTSLPGADGWGTMEFLEKIPANTPGWLRDEWMANATDAMKSLYSLNDDSLAIAISKYPEIAAELEAHAETIRKNKKPSFDDESWLRRYESLQK